MKGAELYICPEDVDMVYQALRYIANEDYRAKLYGSAARLREYADVLREQMDDGS